MGGGDIGKGDQINGGGIKRRFIRWREWGAGREDRERRAEACGGVFRNGRWQCGCEECGIVVEGEGVER